jgi:hypothetical protein
LRLIGGLETLGTTLGEGHVACAISTGDGLTAERQGLAWDS